MTKTEEPKWRPRQWRRQLASLNRAYSTEPHPKRRRLIRDRHGGLHLPALLLMGIYAVGALTLIVLFTVTEGYTRGPAQLAADIRGPMAAASLVALVAAIHVRMKRLKGVNG